MKWLGGIMLMLATATLQPASASRTYDIASYQALVQEDLRLAIVGHRLATANASFCQRKTRNPGWVLHDKAQYPDAIIAQAAFAFRAPVAVSAIVPGGAAETAGIATGDAIVAFNGTAISNLPFTGQERASARLEKVLDVIAAALDSSGRANIVLLNAQGQREVTLAPPAMCASRFWVDTKSDLDAGADGVSIRVTEGLLAFTSDDDAQLAAIVAHEMAHNLLGHRQRLSKDGKSSRQILATEVEADRLSVWLMSNAGYDPAAALRFAERYGRKTDKGILSDGTHLRWKNRYRVMQEEIMSISQAAMADGLRSPPLLTAASF